MDLLPKSKEEFSQKEYWDSFFKKRGNKAFEWYGEYPELSKYLHKYIKKHDDILIMGCGNSTLGRDLYDIGYSGITNIDISNIVIRQMQSQNDKQRPGLKYIQMDALNTSFQDQQFSVILDKGTLDALMPDESEDTMQTIDRYFAEVQRLLRIAGRYVCISLLQEHILRKLLDYFPKNSWMFRVERCYESQDKSMEVGGNSMPVFIVLCTKFACLPRLVLEVNLGQEFKLTKCASTHELAAMIASVQRAAFVCSSLKKSNLTEGEEITLELFDSTNQILPRYTIYVVEATSVGSLSYAVFIVPEGRESEWLFSTKAGRKHLLSATKQHRLMIATLHRGHIYSSMEMVQKDLGGVAKDLAPESFNNKKIAFLTMGQDLGKRIVQHEGCSPFSGKYVIEDVDHDVSTKYRRLYYLSSQLVIQSEAKIKNIRSRSGKRKEIIDLYSLTCQHHIYMSIAAYLSVKGKQNSKVTVLGLGGGGLCSFLHLFLPDSEITGVDIDPEMKKIATDWFGFKEDAKLKAVIQDGLDYIRDLQLHGNTVDVILCDVDSKNAEIGMSCPPKEFLSDVTLQMISKSIANQGLFVVNVVLRDNTLRPEILQSLRKFFRMVIAYKLAEDLNEIFICNNMEGKSKILKDNLSAASETINKFFKEHNTENEIDVEEYMKDLKINS